MAVSVASGTPCLDVFASGQRGRVLVYMAEDAEPVVRERLEALCRHRRLDIEALDLFAIVADRLRIDRASDQQRLRETMRRLRPRMLLLDPLIRVHTADENSSAEVSAMLAYLRALQREHAAAVVLVHHTRKSGSNGQPGQALRGSGDWHAFGDSNVYLRRKGKQILLSIEHRAAPSPDPLTLELVEGDMPHLAIVSDVPTVQGLPLDEAIVALLDAATGPMTRAALRTRLRTRNERLGKTLSELEERELIRRVTGGWVAVSVADRSPCESQGSVGTERSAAAS